MIFVWGSLLYVALLLVWSGIIYGLSRLIEKKQLQHKDSGFGYGDFTVLRNDFSAKHLHMYTGKRAVVACSRTSGGDEKIFTYRGYSDCKSLSMLYSGDNACQWGCLGKGDCVDSCTCNAIVVENGAARIGQTCIGCGDCVSVCPQHLISLVPVTADYAVMCSSGAGADTSALCTSGCTACGKCAVSAGYAGFRMDYKKHHAYLDYKGTGSRDIGKKLCAPGCIEELPNTEKNDYKKYRFWIIINRLQDVFTSLFNVHKAG